MLTENQTISRSLNFTKPHQFSATQYHVAPPWCYVIVDRKASYINCNICDSGKGVSKPKLMPLKWNFLLHWSLSQIWNLAIHYLVSSTTTVHKFQIFHTFMHKKLSLGSKKKSKFTIRKTDKSFVMNTVSTKHLRFQNLFKIHHSYRVTSFS